MTHLEKMLQPDSQYVFYDDEHGFCINTDDVLMLFESERKKGVWIVKKDCEGKTRTCICGLCGYTTDKYTWKNPNYCSGCGADMRGEQE